MHLPLGPSLDRQKRSLSGERASESIQYVPRVHAKNVFGWNVFSDLPLRDLGRRCWRKTNIFNEPYEPCGRKDCRGLNYEWLWKTESESRMTASRVQACSVRFVALDF